MRILVFDHCLKVTGHRLPYAALVANAFYDCDVVLGLPKLIENHPSVSPYLDSSFNVDFYDAKVSSSSIAKAFEARKCLLNLVKLHRPELVAIPTADGVAIVVGLLNLLSLNRQLRETKIDICLIKGQQRLKNRSTIKQYLANLKWWITRQGPWQRILLIDPRDWSNVKNPTSQEIFLCPDPVPKQKFTDRLPARQNLKLPTDGRLIVAVGGQNIRKGSDLLINAFKTAELNINDRLLLMGKVSQPIVPLINSLKQNPEFESRLIIRDEYVSEDEFQMAIVASDLVAIPYRSVDRPSGIVCRSMAWNRPIIASNRGWLKWILEEFDAGFAANPEDATEFGNAIKLALDQSCEFNTTKKAREFISYNTEQNYMHVWRNGLERAADSVTAGPLSLLQNT